MAVLNDIYSWVINGGVPKAQSILTDSAAAKLSVINAPLSKEISVITGTVPPKATSTDMIQGYLTKGVDIINAVTGAISTVKTAATQVTAPAKVITVGGAATGSAVSTTTPQVNLPDNVIVLPGQVSTQGAQTVQAQDNSWIIWIVIALFVLAGIYLVTKGK